MEVFCKHCRTHSTARAAQSHRPTRPSLPCLPTPLPPDVNYVASPGYCALPVDREWISEGFCPSDDPEYCEVPNTAPKVEIVFPWEQNVTVTIDEIISVEATVEDAEEGALQSVTWYVNSKAQNVTDLVLEIPAVNLGLGDH